MTEISPKTADRGIERQKKARRRLIMIGSAIIVAVAVWYFVGVSPITETLSLGTSIENSILGQSAQNFSAPPPLEAPASSSGAATSKSYTLTRAGVITDTNSQRAANGDLPPLAESDVLDDVAALRLDDMFAKQYFAHVSPTGESAETVASTVGYTYLDLGENLALGNFIGDNGVVTAWMNSPGHRANILNTHYTQIGVAVSSGIFNGQRTWLAVQVFGRPSSDCPSPDTSLKTQIDTDEANASTSASNLATEKAQIDSSPQKFGPTYDDEVNTYNTNVNEYNALVAQVKTEVTDYNTEVEAFNTCIGT